MLRNICRSLPLAALLVLTAGCVEQTQIITLNPDGRGKIQYELRGPAQSPLTSGAHGAGKEKSLAEMLTDSVAKEMAKPGITAWKDVSANWDPDGKFHFTGTAYFDRLENLRSLQGKNEMNFEMFDLAIDKDKGFTLKLHKNEPNQKKQVPDFAKMTEKEKDEYILKQRIQYQSSKGIIVAMFTDLRIKTEIRLPGDVQKIAGFKKKDARVVTRELNGAAVLTAMNKFMSQDNATLKKWFKDAKNPDPEMFFATELMLDASVTVPKLGAAQFDYDQEVKDARAAYPALRKKLGLGDKVKLPGE